MQEDNECAICFEDITEMGGSMSLPCACRVSYCTRCWDRSLAASVSACGAPRCPSCRSAMSVDFDPDAGRLKFSCAPSPRAGKDDWRRRLYAQARPLQIRLLQQYGEECAALASRQVMDAGSGGEASGSSAPSGGGGSALALPETPGGSPAVSSGEGAASSGSAATRRGVARAGGGSGAATTPSPPKCICGSRLTRGSTQNRVLAFICEGAPLPPPRSQLQVLIKNPPIVCDVCARPVRTPNVWTCENGRRTVLHAAAYDVCEECFAEYAFGEGAGDNEDTLSHRSGEEDEGDDFDDCESSDDSDWGWGAWG